VAVDTIMARILIPRSDNISAKPIESADTTKLFCEVVNDYVKCGIVVTGVACMRSLSITSGVMRLCGLHLNNSSTDTSITCLAACDTHFLFARVCLDGASNPDEWTFTTNTTGCAPANSMRISSVVVGACCITSVCSGSANRVTAAVTGVEDESFYGDGRDGCVTICGCTDLMCDNNKKYNNLTLAACATLTADCPFIIRVRCKLCLGACSSITMTGKGPAGGVGCCPTAPGGGDGGGNLRVWAKEITGTGSILSLGNQGTDTCTSVSGTITGCDGCNGLENGAFTANGGHADTPVATGGGGGGAGCGSGGAGGSGGGSGGAGYTVDCFEFLYQTTNGGGGGSGVALGNTCGGGAGAGGGGFIYLMSGYPLPAITLNVTGGKGGDISATNGNNRAGGGGGGGHVYVISPCDCCATVTVVGGAGGVASNGNSSNFNGAVGSCGGCTSVIF